MVPFHILNIEKMNLDKAKPIKRQTLFTGFRSEINPHLWHYDLLRTHLNLFTQQGSFHKFWAIRRDQRKLWSRDNLGVGTSTSSGSA